MGDRQNQDVIRFLDVDDGVRKGVAKVPPRFAAKRAMQMRRGADFSAQAFDLGRKAARQGEAFPLVIFGGGKQIGARRGMQDKGASLRVTTAELRHDLLAGDARHFPAADFVEPAADFNGPELVDFRVGATAGQSGLIPLGKLFLFTGGELFKSRFQFGDAHGGYAVGFSSGGKPAVAKATTDKKAAPTVEVPSCELAGTESD